MKYMYVMDKEVAEELRNKKLLQIGTTIINGQEAYIFENNRDTYIGKYEKTQIVFANRLMF